MAFLKKRENLILTGIVILFFAGLILWHDVGGIRSGLCSAPNESEAFNLVFVNGDNEPKTLAEFKGKPMIVNFWATWCPVCVEKMGSLNRVAEKVKAAGGEVLAISNDQTGIGTVKAFYIKNHYKNLPIYIDSRGQLLHAYGGRGLPTTLLIDTDGDVVGRIEGGFDWDSSKAHTILKEKLGLDINN